MDGIEFLSEVSVADWWRDIDRTVAGVKEIVSSDHFEPGHCCSGFQFWWVIWFSSCQLIAKVAKTQF